MGRALPHGLSSRGGGVCSGRIERARTIHAREYRRRRQPLRGYDAQSARCATGICRQCRGLRRACLSSHGRVPSVESREPLRHQQAGRRTVLPLHVPVPWAERGHAAPFQSFRAGPARPVRIVEFRPAANRDRARLARAGAARGKSRCETRFHACGRRNPRLRACGATGRKRRSLQPVLRRVRLHRSRPR